MDKKVKKRSIRNNGCLGGILMFLLLVCVSVALATFMWMAASDMLALNNKSFSVTIELPETAFVTSANDESKTVDIDYVADLLHKNGLIDYPWLFKEFCNLSHAETKLDPGEYELKSSYDYRALIKNMQEGTGILRTVTITIPEGYTMYQIFKKFDEEGVATYEQLMDAAANATFKYDFLDGKEDLGANRLEGFLFPDTYEFYVHMDAASAINKMLSNFYVRFNQDLINACNNSGYSMYDILKIASYIEKEAKYDDDRFKVSAVIRNRLNAQYTLGLDTTILYIHPEHQGEPDAAMLVEDSPYNTRTNYGFTPTPICNPGMASIQAALNPEPNCYYYYFYADIDTGRLQFFQNLYEFEAYAAEQEELHSNGG